jgi:hypothetical protein
MSYCQPKSIPQFGIPQFQSRQECDLRDNLNNLKVTRGHVPGRGQVALTGLMLDRQLEIIPFFFQLPQ